MFRKSNRPQSLASTCVVLAIVAIVGRREAYGDPGVAFACPPSPLGYQCSTTFAGPFTYHWTVNATAPSNVCTGKAPSATNSSSAATGVDPSQGVLHMLVEAPTTGWVGVSFAAQAASMFPADAALGWVDGSGAVTVGTWYIDSYTTIASGGLQAALNPSWAYAMGVAQSTAGGSTSTLLCFSRKWLDPASQIYSALPASGPTQMNWAYADNGITAFVQHKYEGGVALDLASGTLTEVATKNYIYQINVHGALMMVAWVFLLPVGALIPRHKWIMGEAKLFGVHLWFRLHVLLQLTGTGLFIAGFVYDHALKEFPSTLIGGDVGIAHQNLGIAVLAMAAAQVCVGFVRPAPDDKTIRPYWSMLHRWLGWLTVLAAWTDVYLGVYIYHVTPDYAASYSQWLVPAIVAMATLVLLDISLTLWDSTFRPPSAPLPLPPTAELLSPYNTIMPDNKAAQEAAMASPC